jgi:hypothetical protein
MTEPAGDEPDLRDAIQTAADALAQALELLPAPKPPPRWQRGTKTQITLSIAPELLDRLDEVAKRKYVSRAALVAMWLNDRLEQETA